MIRLLFTMVFLSVLLSSCGDEPITEQLSENDQKLADSIFFSIKPDLVKDLDTLCQIHQSKEFDRLVDSIKEKRIEEIEKIMGQ